MPQSLYLASASPRRKELLAQLGVDFCVVANDFDETPFAHEAPEAYVQRLAVGKALSALPLLSAEQKHQGIPILGADTIVVLGEELLGKPKDCADAVQMLTRLSGRSHHVYTGVAIVTDSDLEPLVTYSKTRVDFSALNTALIQRYCETQEPFGKAGSYAIQGLAASFIDSIEGSYSGVVGLPLKETRLLLEQAQVASLLNPQET